MYEILIKHIRELVPIKEREVELIIEAFQPTHLKKKEILLQKGDPSNHMRFVAQGCLKAYHIAEEGNEHIYQFGISGWWVNDLYAYLAEKPADFFIQAITDSIVLQIHRVKLNQLFNDIPMMERFFRIKTQNAYVALQERTLKNLSESAEQRYHQFVKRYREMEQQIPQYMIASYLGVTPEHLSTIRKKMSIKYRS